MRLLNAQEQTPFEDKHTLQQQQVGNGDVVYLVFKNNGDDGTFT